MELKHFVTFIAHTLSHTKEVKDNEICALKIPDRVYAIKTFDKPTRDIWMGDKKIAQKNQVLNEKLYYIGTIVTLDQLKDCEEYQQYVDNKYIGAIKTRQNGRLHPIKQNERFNLISPEDVGVVITKY